jgi:exodeoxyribonuclease V gamma subunit
MLRVHRGSRGDALADGLAAMLREPSGADPFVAEVVAVPTRGVERWLTQRLATVLGTRPGRGDGVCAHVDFPFPASLVATATAAPPQPATDTGGASVAGVDPDDDPWTPARAVWPLLEVLEARIDEPWLGPLAAHLGAGGAGPDGARRSRWWPTARHLADLFDRYGVQRPAMVRAWAAGDDADGLGGPLRDDVVWQATLWRALRVRLDGPSPAERLDEACRHIRARPDDVALPSRLSLFGLTRLPGSHLDVLTALGEARDVHLWLLHPSAALWASLEAVVGSGEGTPRRRGDPAAERVRNPLLATWGRDAREMQTVLARGGATDGVALPDPDAPATILGRIQADVRADRPPPPDGGPASGPGRGAGRMAPGGAGTNGPPAPAGPGPDGPLVPDPGDRSLQVHACHGRARQVEVLRDAILRLLADDPTLEPRDVIVMCPDIDAFAPLLTATFGPGEVTAGRDLHVRLADRSIRQTNPVLGAVAALLDLAAGRVTVSDVVDLIGCDPIRYRFGFDDDELTRIDEWVRGAGARWGLDADGRRPYGLAHVGAGTWKTGLDRLLLGVAMSEDDLRTVGGVLPYDDVGSGDVDLVGRLAEVTDRLDTALRDLSGIRPLTAWTETIAGAAASLMATPDADAWQLHQLRSVLDGVLAEARVSGGGGTALTLGELRALLADRLRGRPTRANFRTGHLTMCTLVPMRSVPHRVVALLGLDDGVFPRPAAPDGDDILALDPVVGDRDGRSEDRQLLLDALLAAGDHLVVTYCARDERTNATRPPSVPVGELLDVVDRTVADPAGRRGRDLVVVQHPLQPFDPRNFEADRLVPDGPWSFDPVALAGAEASRLTRTPAPAFAVAPLPARPCDPLEVDDLVRFVQHPVKAYLRQRLDIRVAGDWPEPDDTLPIELDALERWQVGDRLLRDRLAGVGAADARRAEIARGGLPPGRLGDAVLDKLEPDVDALVAAAGAGRVRSVDVTVDLGGRTLVGTVAEVVGPGLRTVTYSKLGPKQRLAAWVRLLVLSAAMPERPWTARTVGRGRKPGHLAVATVGPLGDDPDRRREAALAALAVLVDLYDRSQQGPVPLACRSSAAWVEAGRAGRDPAAAAAGAWVSSRDRHGEDGDPAHVLALDGVISFDELVAAPPLPDETGPGWADDEPTRFGRLAHRLWDGLLAVEVVTG